MCFSKNKNIIGFGGGRPILSKEDEFYLHTDKSEKNLVPRDRKEIKIDKSLQEIVEKSDLFKEEDKKRFVFE